jgi:hypothetical protein
MLRGTPLIWPSSVDLERMRTTLSAILCLAFGLTACATSTPPGQRLEWVEIILKDVDAKMSAAIPHVQPQHLAKCDQGYSDQKLFGASSARTGDYRPSRRHTCGLLATGANLFATIAAAGNDGAVVYAAPTNDPQMPYRLCTFVIRNKMVEFLDWANTPKAQKGHFCHAA